MYKEFYEIANDLIPNILKDREDEKDAVSFTKDPTFFSNMLQFYDGICLWEEGSLTPVIHADWAKKLVQAINKFTPECRSMFSLDKEKEKRDKEEEKRNKEEQKKDKEVDKRDKKEEKSDKEEGKKDKEEEKSDKVEEKGDKEEEKSEREEEKSAKEEEKKDKEEKSSKPTEPTTTIDEKEQPTDKPAKPEISLVLKSAKMKDLRKLITSSGKLNTSAIKLQLTAQSQVSVPKNRRRSSLKADVYLYDYDEQIKEEGAGDEDDDLFVARKKRKRKNDDRNWSAAQF